MEKWTGDFFVLKDGAGQEYVSVSLPMGGRAPQLTVKKYRASGEKCPIRMGAVTAVSNAEKWMAERVSEGFVFASE